MNTRPIGRPLLGSSQVLAFTATHAESNPVPKGINCLRLLASADCFVAVSQKGTPATATDSMLIKTGTPPEYIAVSEGDIVSVLQSTTGGNLYITPIGQASN